jgi:hypothetical protein
MYTFKSNASMVVLFALAAVIVVYSSVYLNIDAATLSAQMPIE